MLTMLALQGARKRLLTDVRYSPEINSGACRLLSVRLQTYHLQEALQMLGSQISLENVTWYDEVTPQSIQFR